MVESSRNNVELRSGEMALELAPEVGGSVSRFTHAGRHLMRPLSVPEGAPAHAVLSGMFPMLPFANSLRDNRFEFEGRRYEVQPNMAGSRLNYHGSGWQRPWRVTELGSDHCRLVLDEVEETPGYSFAGEQRFILGPAALQVDVSVTSRSHRRMPFGLGLHPWFPRHGEAIVAFAARQVLVEDANFHAVELAAISPEQDFTSGLEPPRSYQNRCYAGWDGEARITWPALRLSLVIRAEPLFGHLMFHVPPHDGETFCLEPQTNRTSAFDKVGQASSAPGVYILEPGETLSGRVVLAVEVAT